jgi:hypothetical protein
LPSDRDIMVLTVPVSASLRRRFIIFFIDFDRRMEQFRLDVLFGTPIRYLIIV